MTHDRHLQTRVTVFRGMDRAAGDAALSAYGELYGRMQRKLFAEVRAGRPAASLKRAYVKDHEIPARMFNGVRVSLEGKIASVREAQKLHRDILQRRIARAERQISGWRGGPVAAGPSEAAPAGQPAIRTARIGSRYRGRASTDFVSGPGGCSEAASLGGQRVCQS